jgi:anaerobic selenocysteine-containing dehydrogenase
LQITRREFIKQIGVVAAVTAISPGIQQVISSISSSQASVQQTNFSEGQVDFIKSTCVHCVNFCGIKIKVVDNVIRAVYPDEDRAEFYNWGICPKGVSGVFNTYNPYRIKAPLKRSNPNKGPSEDPQWVEISWEEAFTTIATKMATIRTDDPRKFIWQHAHGKYLIGDKFPKAFAKAYGTPNLVHRTTVCEAARHVADEITWGYHGHLPDLEYSDLLLNFGANYFEAEQWARWLDHTVTDAQERGLRLVVIEPRLSNLAGKADEWVPMRPGKDVVFLLAMANVLIENNYVDEDFLIEYTNAPFLVGADGKILVDDEGNPFVWDTSTLSATLRADAVGPALTGSYEVDAQTYRTAFQVFSDNVQETTPAFAAAICGVSAETITRIALEFGQKARIGSTIILDGETLRHRPVAIHTFRGLSAKEYGVQTSRAALLVQMLVGNIDAVGGFVLHSVYKTPRYMEPSPAEYPPSRVDLQESVFFPHATHNVAQQVALTLLDPQKYSLEYQPEMQIVYASNRLFSASDSNTQIEGYKDIFTVVIDIVMCEMAYMADIVLPDLTYLESWHYAPTRYTINTKHYAIRRPAANVYNIQYDAYAVLWELAKRLGIRDDYIAQINSQWKLTDNQALLPGTDYNAAQTVQRIWFTDTGHTWDYAKEHGFYGKKLNAHDAYLKGIEAKFKGPDAPKMHFYCDELVASYENVETVATTNNITDIDLPYYKTALSPLPLKEHANPIPHKEAPEIPFYLITFKRIYRNQSGQTALNPILNKVSHNSHTNSVWINTSAAQDLNIADGDIVTLESRIGKTTAIANLTEGVRPDTVAVSYHYGQWSPGFPDYARTGTNINEIVELHPDVIAGMNSANDTKVYVYKE